MVVLAKMYQIVCRSANCGRINRLQQGREAPQPSTCQYVRNPKTGVSLEFDESQSQWLKENSCPLESLFNAVMAQKRYRANVDRSGVGEMRG